MHAAEKKTFQICSMYILSISITGASSTKGWIENMTEILSKKFSSQVSLWNTVEPKGYYVQTTVLAGNTLLKNLASV
jgi:hypothetical protein